MEKLFFAREEGKHFLAVFAKLEEVEVLRKMDSDKLFEFKLVLL